VRRVPGTLERVLNLGLELTEVRELDDAAG
jgi:hypothetical protein